MIQLNLSIETEQKLKQVMMLHNNKDIFFNKVIDFQINELKNGIKIMQQDLKKFELEYKMDSKSFYLKFEKGELGDMKDYLLWAGIYEMYLRDKNKIKKLE